MSRKRAKKNNRRLLGAAGAIGAAVAAGAGAYYLLGPKSKQHQRKARAFAKKLEGEWSGKQRTSRSATKKTKRHA